VLQIVVTDQFD